MFMCTLLNCIQKLMTPYNHNIVQNSAIRSYRQTKKATLIQNMVINTKNFHTNCMNQYD